MPVPSLFQVTDALSLSPGETRALLSFCGLIVAVCLWALKVCLRVGVELRDAVRDLHHAVFGDKTHADPNGLMRDFAHFKKVSNERNNNMQVTLLSIERELRDAKAREQ